MVSRTTDGGAHVVGAGDDDERQPVRAGQPDRGRCPTGRWSTSRRSCSRARASSRTATASTWPSCARRTAASTGRAPSADRPARHRRRDRPTASRCASATTCPTSPSTATAARCTHVGRRPRRLDEQDRAQPLDRRRAALVDARDRQPPRRGAVVQPRGRRSPTTASSRVLYYDTARNDRARRRHPDGRVPAPLERRRPAHGARRSSSRRSTSPTRPSRAATSSATTRASRRSGARGLLAFFGVTGSTPETADVVSIGLSR